MNTGYPYFCLARTIFSLSLCLFSNCFLLCFRSFSSLLLIAASSSFLICCAFFTTLGMCLWRLIRLISGMWPYRSDRDWLYSRAWRCRADLMPCLSDAFARHSYWILN